MAFENMGSELPPQFYNLPQGFSTLAEMNYFAAGMAVNAANETRALRFAVENLCKKLDDLSAKLDKGGNNDSASGRTEKDPPG